jgi:hypothetical protein
MTAVYISDDSPFNMLKYFSEFYASLGPPKNTEGSASSPAGDDGKLKSEIMIKVLVNTISYLKKILFHHVPSFEVVFERVLDTIPSNRVTPSLGIKCFMVSVKLLPRLQRSNATISIFCIK